MAYERRVRRRSKAPWIIGAALVALCCGGAWLGVLSSGDDPAADTAAEAAVEPATKAPVLPRLNQAARDGKFEFKVAKVRCGATRVGNDLIGDDAQGVFCLVDVSVRNIGQRSQLFDGSSQKAYDSDGTEFSHDGAAALYANGGADVFLELISPGNQSKGTLVFDVPKGTKLTTIELHDSPFSGGVKVALAARP